MDNQFSTSKKYIDQVLRDKFRTSRNKNFNTRVIKLFCQKIGVKYGITVNSGTSGLHSALLSLNLNKNDEVLMPAITMSAVAYSIILSGAKPVFVDIDTPGLTFGNNENLMGWRGIPSADIYFDNVEVPIENLLVEPEDGFKKLMETFDLERCGNATMALAQASSALDYVQNYVQEREQFGKPIVDFQAVQIKLADMLMKVEASRLLIHRAVFNAANGLPDILESSSAKCFANEISREVTTTAMQLMGGYGFNKEYGMERKVRDSFGWGIAGGTIDVQKVNIASAMIGRRFNQRAK